MGQFSNSFPKHFSYLCEYAFRFDLSCSFCEYPFIFHCLHCSPSCFDPDSFLLAHLWLGLSWIDCISANKRFSSPKTSSRKPYTSSKQQERQKHSVETTINFSPKQAAEEAQENPKVAELKERLINAYPRLFSGVANKNPPDRGRFGTARIKLKPNPKIYRHREYQLQGDRAEALKKLLAEFIERGWIEPSDSEWASPAFIVPKKEKGEWRLVVDCRGLNEQTKHDSYSLPLIDTILQKQQKKRIFTVLDLKHGYHQMPLHPDSRPCSDVDAAGAHAVERGAYGRQEWQRRFPAHDGGPNRSCPGLCRFPSWMTSSSGPARRT